MKASLKSDSLSMSINGRERICSLPIRGTLPFQTVQEVCYHTPWQSRPEFAGLTLVPAIDEIRLSHLLFCQVLIVFEPLKKVGVQGSTGFDFERSHLIASIDERIDLLALVIPPEMER